MVNRVTLIGNLGKDAEMKYTENGLAICNFSLATSETWTKDGKKNEKTEWHKVVAFDKLAEICGQYLAKGKQVYIEGKIQTRSWDDKDGTKKYITEIVAHTMKMLGNAGGVKDAGVSASPAGSAEDMDDIPF